MSVGFKSNMGVTDRNSWSRAEMVSFIQNYLDDIVIQVKDWIAQVDERHVLMNKDKNAIFLEHRRFEKHMTEKFQQYLDDETKNLEEKGFRV